MTKLPGTDEGFPADNWYVFNRLRTNYNPKNPGHSYSYDSKEVVRVHNVGEAQMEITELSLSDPSSFAFEKRDFELLPIKIQPGEHYDLTVLFVKSDAFWDGAKGVYSSDLLIKSTGGDAKATLSGYYQLRPEGAYEPAVSDIVKLFGLNSKVPFGKHTAAYPTPVRKPGTDYGEIVVSEYWQQADVTKPVIAMVLFALGGGGNPNLKFIDGKDQVVGGFEFMSPGRRMIHGESVWVCQTVFPPEENDPNRVVGKSVARITEPFRISISDRSTSGTGEVNPETGKPALLALRMFHVKDKYGIIRKPNDYLLCFDVVSKKGSHANSDFNDYVIYLSNIQPRDGKPEIDRTKY